MKENIIYIKNPDDMALSFLPDEKASFIILINENIERKYKYIFTLKNENSYAKILFLIIAKKDSKLDFNIQVNHENSDTHIDLKFKTVLYKTAEISFLGNIFVKEKLKNISSSMIHHNISDSKESLVISKPNLEINSDQVEINHGFASEKFSSEEEFYLKSRGIDKKTIKKIQIKSFLFAELNNKMDKELKKQIKKDIICSMQKN